MGADFVKFQDMLASFIEDEVPRKFVRRQIEITIFLLTKLQEYTPQPREGEAPNLRKSTGHAVANWRVTMNTPPTDVKGSREFPARKTMPESVRASLTQGGKARVFKELHVFNNVHYIGYLDAGWSDQAPAGMVDRALNATRTYISMKGWL